MQPGPVSGSRGNGLPGASWVSVADLDPRVADALLDRLRDEGIAAYVAPAQHVDPVVGSTRSGTLKDRLWVDGEAASRAKEIVAEAAEPDFDAAWQGVLDSLRTEQSEPVGRWPVSEDLDSPASVVSRPGKTYDEYEAERQARYDEEDHYVPPPPPPVGRPARYTVGALVAVAVGIILLFDPLQLGGNLSLLLGVLAIAGGVGALIYRMKEGPPVDDGPDDGAVV